MRKTMTALMALAMACGGSDDPVSTVEISVQFPGSAAERSTNSLHFWILAPHEEAAITCRALRGGDADPYQSPVSRLADFVVFTADSQAGTAEEVARGDSLVYVEGVDFIGDVILAGCVPLAVNGATETVGVNLGAPGTYDCADPETESGDPCDDGLFCTVDETCSGGSCSGGGPRNCTFVADECNAESCSEELGCQPSPVPNGRPCEDGQYCTTGDTCTDGECVSGDPRDCSGDDGVCRVGECREDLDDCVPVIDDTLSCDDGLYCTIDDDCNVAGSCVATPQSYDCSAAADDCNDVTCSEGASAAVCQQVPLTGSASCTTNCMSGGNYCNVGVCEGGTPIDPGGTTESTGDGNCDDFIDNDCDGLKDAADPDC